MTDRPTKIVLRCSPEERAIIADAARHAGLEVAAYARTRLLEIARSEAAKREVRGG